MEGICKDKTSVIFRLFILRSLVVDEEKMMHMKKQNSFIVRVTTKNNPTHSPTKISCHVIVEGVKNQKG